MRSCREFFSITIGGQSDNFHPVRNIACHFQCALADRSGRAKKTWEGFFGAIVFALLCSLGLFKLMPGHLSALNWTHATILGVLLGFAAVVGDLAESIIKRSTDVKDSGNLLPGIGGALDLLDSLLFTAPLLFFYLRLVIRVP
ncbi:MAG: hypothetical protein DME48_14630 [Verrucomicrobia bacterium]|nr:MAG: hypothetical protein DME48_14630 [Verrucomicrobiota bacterium]